ncbi:unnamed protein product, partial [Choristocarpus tenellus]
MAMPTRSVRNTGFGEGTPTPVTVGPGSYLRSTTPFKVRPPFKAFASSVQRSSQGPTQEFDSPGPGTYDVPSLVNKNSKISYPSSSFDSKAPRLAPQYTGSTPFRASTNFDVPGPGTYNSDSSSSGELLRATNHSNIRQRSAPLVERRFNPPSVPRRDQSFGYNEDAQGKLLPLPAPIPTRSGTHGDTVGPGDYNPTNTHRWTGSNGAKLANGQRKTVFDDEWVSKARRPGPGDYDPKLRPQYQVETQGSSSFMSEVPKGSYSKTRGRPGPGPGQYAPEQIACTTGATSGIQCFGSTAQRSTWLRNEK